MQNNRQGAAIQRGIKAAALWKKIRNGVAKWDIIFVGWAKSHKLPGWLGHIPIALTIMFSVASILLGGLLIGLVVTFVWMAIVGLSSIPDRPSYDHDDTRDDSPQYRNGDQGLGLYSGPDDLISSYNMDD